MFNLSVQDSHFLPHCGCEIHLQVEKGDFITLVGENGVGKSTLAERIYQQLPEHISFIQQKPLEAFYDRTLKKVKDIFLNIRGTDISREMFLELWGAFLLSQKEDRLQSALSGGEGQALKLCLGLSINRPLYILDEPSQFLDTSSKKVLKKILGKLIDTNRTIIMIEHDLSWVDLPMKVKELAISQQVLKEKSTWTT